MKASRARQARTVAATQTSTSGPKRGTHLVTHCIDMLVVVQHRLRSLTCPAPVLHRLMVVLLLLTMMILIDVVINVVMLTVTVGLVI